MFGSLPAVIGNGGCPFAAIFGVPCPGCGMTRAVLLLMNGEVTASLRMHPLVVPSALAAVVLMAASIWVTAKTGSPAGMWRDRIGRYAIVAFLGVETMVFGLWLARMLGAMGGPVPVG
jgi:Protein of unknown function (DUF2752)